MKSAITWISAAHAGVALASFLAVRAMVGVFDLVSPFDGTGLGPELMTEVARAARWPMVAAWVAAAASIVALLLARGAAPEERSRRSAALAAIAIAAGVAAVLAFRTTATFITYGILPPGEAVGHVFGRLMSASTITALCCAAALVVAVMALRTRATMRLAVVTVVVDLGVSAAVVVMMRDLSARVSTWPMP